MKKVYTLVICIIIASSAFAQPNTFAPVGAKWYYGATNSGRYNYNYYMHESVKDTTIMGQACRKINTTFNGGTNVVQSHYFYGDTNKVYHFNPVYQKFCLFFDFTVKAGDTVRFYKADASIYYPEDSIYHRVIETVEYINLCGEQVKMIGAHLLESGFIDSYATYAGDMFTFIPLSGARIPEEDGPFRCYIDQLTEIKCAAKACDNIVDGIEEVKDANALTVYPNPASDYIQLSEPLQSYALINTMGEVVRQNHLSHSITIRVGELPNGIYLLRATAGKELVYKKVSVQH